MHCELVLSRVHLAVSTPLPPERMTWASSQWHGNGENVHCELDTAPPEHMTWAPSESRGNGTMCIVSWFYPPGSPCGFDTTPLYKAHDMSSRQRHENAHNVHSWASKPMTREWKNWTSGPQSRWHELPGIGKIRSVPVLHCGFDTRPLEPLTWAWY